MIIMSGKDVQKLKTFLSTISTCFQHIVYTNISSNMIHSFYALQPSGNAHLTCNIQPGEMENYSYIEP